MERRPFSFRFVAIVFETVREATIGALPSRWRLIVSIKNQRSGDAESKMPHALASDPWE